MAYKAFYNYCNRIVQEWYKEYDQSKYIPEPFYGDPESSSIVVININPGGGYDEGQTRETVPEEIVASYSSYAKEFPYLNPSIKSLNPPLGDSWWRNRKDWLDRIVECSCRILHRECPHLYPFGLELYPWPSSRIGLLDRTKRVVYPELFHVAEQATSQSIVPFAVAIGKTVVNELVKNNYECLNTWSYHKHQPACRTYQLLVNRERKHYVLATWARGSNRPPSCLFQEFEKTIITEIVSIINAK